VTATICQYEPAQVASKAVTAPLRRLVLRGTAADGLRAVLTETNPMTSQAVKCSRPANLPSVQLIDFSYRDGRTARAVVTSTDCGLTVVAAGGRFGLLPSPLQEDLGGYAMVTAHQRGPRVPNLIGLSAQDAASLTRRQHVTMVLDGEVVDQAVPPGTIIFQVPPARSDFGLGPNSLGTIVAVHNVPVCLPSQLRLTYRAGGVGAGSDFGTILFRDVTAASCRLAGRLQITGVSASGRADTSTLTAVIPSPGVLAPNMQPVRDLAPVPLGILTWLLAADYRDDPTSPDALCIAHYVIPAGWRVRLADGSLVKVPNADRADIAPLSSSGGLVTCRGRLGDVSQVTLGGG
jgi:hypothetical protein